MEENKCGELPDFDDDVAHVEMVARKATRKAARVANRAGYFVEHALGACVVKSPKQVLKITSKSTPINVNKRYAFAEEKR
jgi:hypothetical protein